MSSEFLLEINLLRGEIFVTCFVRSHTVGALLQHDFLNYCSLIIRVSEVGRIGSFLFILLVLSSTDI